jgi:hypothetical protein
LLVVDARLCARDGAHAPDDLGLALDLGVQVLDARQQRTFPAPRR